MTGKWALGVSALVFISYGVVSLISPATPASFAGLIISNGNAYAEVASMYGGLQTGLGVFFLLALLRAELYRSGLILLVVGIGALAAARSLAVVIHAEPVTTYTYGALVFEWALVAAAAFALRSAADKRV